MKTEAPTGDMNRDNNNYSNSDNNIGEEDNNQKQSQAWGTWEELLLACAVKRHGFKDWDSVAMEVQTRSSLPRLLTTAQNCKQKYRDLKRRFEERRTDDGDDEGEDNGDEEEGKSGTEDGEDKVDSIPWLEQLRSLRVAELRQDLQRYDVSILSLQLKVKKLEEERERSVGDQKPDLEDDSKGERSENDGTEPVRPNREKAVPAEESDRENRSVNESNSTASGGKTGDDERVGGDGTGQNHEDSVDPDPVCKAAAEGSFSRGSEASHSAELGESGTSVGLGRKRKRKRKGRTNTSGKESLAAGGDETGAAARKSHPLIGFLDMIRAHRHGSVFERRLRTQESKNYKSLIRQHLDLETIKKKLDQGSYSSSTLSFYRDLLLLFTNAVVFFPKSSSESLAAHELRTLVLNEIKKETQKSDSPSPEPAVPVRPRADTTLKAKSEPDRSDSSLARQKSSAPLVVCRKRSSVSTKPSPSSSFSQKDEKKSEEISKEKEKIVTGTRSSRRNKKGNSAVANNTNNKKHMGSKASSSNHNKQESLKVDKKTLASDKKKSVADFLKRIKSSPANSPKKGGGTGKDPANKSSGNGKKDNKLKDRVLRGSNTAKKKAKEDNNPSKQNTGRQLRKTAEPATSLGKRGRETSGSGKVNKPPKKRSRR